MRHLEVAELAPDADAYIGKNITITHSLRETTFNGKLQSFAYLPAQLTVDPLTLKPTESPARALIGIEGIGTLDYTFTPERDAIIITIH